MQLPKAPRFMSVRADYVSVRQPSDRVLRHLHEPLGHHVPRTVEAEAIDGRLGMGFA